MSRREQLLVVIDQDVQRDCVDYQLLQDLMQDLYEQLLVRDCSRIDSLNMLILARLDRLHVHARRRSRVLRAFGLPPGNEGMHELIEQFEPPTRVRLESSWRTLVEGIRGCRRLNERNGNLLSMHHEVLSQLFGGERDHFLYSPPRA